MSDVEALSSAKLPRPRFRYSPLIRAGDFYKTAGMVALSPETGSLESGGAGAETARILANLVAALPDFGLTLDHLVGATIFTTDFERFPQINEAWNQVFTDEQRPPARTAVGVSRLPLNATVEMEFLFYKR